MHRFKGVYLLACMWLAGFQSSLSFATPIQFSETTGGDLVATAAPLRTFNFDVGINTISGQFGLTGTTLDIDSFAFKIPPGTQLVSGNVVLADVAGAADLVDSTWDLVEGVDRDGTNALRTESVFVTSPGSTDLASTPLPPDIFAMIHRRVSVAGSHDSHSSYVFSFTVVPEPTSCALLILGAAGAGVWRTRRS